MTSPPASFVRTALDLDPLCFHTDFSFSLSGSIKMRQNKHTLIHILIEITDLTPFSLSLTLMSSFPSSPNLDSISNHFLTNTLNSLVPLSQLYTCAI